MFLAKIGGIEQSERFKRGKRCFRKRILLTMFLLKSVKFQLVGLVLGLLFKPASPGGQFVLLLPGAGSIS